MAAEKAFFGKRIQGLSWTTILVILNLVAFNLISLKHYSRIDFTENAMYTLSPDTLRVLGELKDTVTVKVFISRDLPPGHERVRRMVMDELDEFKVAAGDKMNLIFLDPSPNDPDVVAEAKGYGIQPVPLRSMRADREETVMGYMALAVLYEGRFETIPALHQCASLEYDLLMKIARVVREVPVTVAFQELPDLTKNLTPEVRAQVEQRQKKKNRRTIERNLSGAAKVLEKFYDVIAVDLARPVPKEVSVLVLPNTHLLDELGLYYADQFLMRGGKLIILKSGVRVNPAAYTCRADRGDLDEWLGHYGITVKKNLVCDKSCVTYPFTVRAGSGRAYQKEIPFRPYIRLLHHFYDQTHPTTASLRNDMLALYCSSIGLKPPEGGKETILFKSSIHAWDQEAPAFEIHPESIVDPGEGAYRQFPLAGLVEGSFSSFFTLRTLSDKTIGAVEKARKGIFSFSAKAVRMDRSGEGGEDRKAGKEGMEGGEGVPAGREKKEEPQEENGGGDVPGGGIREPAAEEVSPGAPQEEKSSSPGPGEGKEPPAGKAGEKAPPEGGAGGGEPGASGRKHPKGMLLQSPETAILVIGCEDFLTNPNVAGLPEETYNEIVMGYLTTLQFFSNAVDYLALGGEFSSIRARDIPQRRIDPEYLDKPNTLLKLAGTGIGVAAVVLLAVILALLRRLSRRKEVVL